MDFTQTLSDQRAKLRSDRYCRFLWGELNNDSPPHPGEDAQNKFLYHLPFNYHEFLASCAEKLRLSIREAKEPDWSKIDQNYLTCLLYHSLNAEDNVQAKESVPLQAASVYLLLHSFAENREVESDHVSSKLLDRCLKVLTYRLSKKRDVTTAVMHDLNIFFTLKRLTASANKAVELLLKVIFSCNTEVFKDFYCGPESNVSHIGFCCLKSMALKECDKPEQKQIVVMIVLSLMKSLESNKDLTNSCRIILQSNVRKFFRMILSQFAQEAWMVGLFKHCAEEYFEKQEFVEILNEFPQDFYVLYTKSLVKDLVTSPRSAKLQVIALHIFKLAYAPQSEESRRRLLQALLRNVIFLFGHEQEGIRESALGILESVLQLEDALVQNTIQGILHADPATEKINMHTIFEVLKKHVDVKWRRMNFNRAFINVMCEIHIRNPEFLLEKHFECLEPLCVKASSADMKPCVSALLRLLKQYVHLYPKITKFVLNVLVAHTCCPTTTANLYIKELCSLIFDTIDANRTNDIAFEITCILISGEFDYQALFKRFHSMNLLRPQTVQVLMDYKVLKQKGAWKLLAVILDYVECNTFPHFMDNYFQMLIEQNLFTLADCNDILCAFSRIVKHKNSTTTTPEELVFLKNLEKFLVDSVLARNVPIKSVGLVLYLLNHLQKSTLDTLEWMTQFFAELDELLHNQLLEVGWNADKLENYEREFAYIGEILISFNHRLSERNKNKLKQILMPTEQQILADSPKAWSMLITLYSKMSLKELDYVDDCVLSLQYALKYGSNYVQHCSFSAMYDMCNIHLQYFDPIIPYLFQFLNSKDHFLRYTSGKTLMKLVNEDHLKLSYTQYIVFVSLLADNNVGIRRHFQELVKETFLNKHQQVIAKYFLHIILHFNNYMDHSCFTFILEDLSELDIRGYNTERRSIIYKHLLWTLSRYNRFQLLDQLTREIFAQCLNGTMPFSSKVLDILHDCTFIITNLCEEDEVVKNLASFYESQTKILKKDVAKKSFHIDPTATKYAEFNNVIKKLLIALTELLHRLETVNKDLMQDVFHATMLCSKSFYDNILKLLNDDGNELRKSLSSLETFYNDHKRFFNTNSRNMRLVEIQ